MLENEDEQYLHAIPYMQFPLLQAGKPYTGERGMIPGIRFFSDSDFWIEQCRKVWEHYKTMEPCTAIAPDSSPFPLTL